MSNLAKEETTKRRKAARAKRLAKQFAPEKVARRAHAREIRHLEKYAANLERRISNGELHHKATLVGVQQKLADMKAA